MGVPLFCVGFSLPVEFSLPQLLNTIVKTTKAIKLNPNLYKEKYQKQTKKYLEEVKSKCFKYKIDFVEVDINQGFEKILNSYLLKRQKIF